MIEFRLGHESRQTEADAPRRVECELSCVSVGQAALVLKGAAPGTGLRVTGFLAARSAKSRTPVLHVNTIEFVEGNENGFQTENGYQTQG